jgi:hypothetical protein
MVTDKPRGRIDERDTMFSRRELQPGTEKYDNYYKRKPENKAPDDNFKTKPGLLKPGTVHYNPFHFAASATGPIPRPPHT